MDTTLAHELRRAERSSTPVGLIMADLDQLKAVNDTYGHETGDLVLREPGQLRLRNGRNRLECAA